MGNGSVAVRRQRSARAAALPRARRAARGERARGPRRVRPLHRRRPRRRRRDPPRRDRVDPNVPRSTRVRRRRRVPNVPRVGRRHVPRQPVLDRVLRGGVVRGLQSRGARDRRRRRRRRDARRGRRGMRGARVPRRSDVRGADGAVAGARDGARGRVRGRRDGEEGEREREGGGRGAECVCSPLRVDRRLDRRARRGEPGGDVKRARGADGLDPRDVRLPARRRGPLAEPRVLLVLLHRDV